MAGSQEQETIIAAGVKVEGDFKSDGGVHIEGEVSGTIKTKGHLRVGPAAKIKADVEALSAVIEGEVVGNMKVTEKLELLDNSVVKGDIETRVLGIAPGAQVNGKLSMGNIEHAPEPLVDEE